MPVFDTGTLLLDSVRSIVDQTLFSETGPEYWELLIIDDGSTDAATHRALEEALRLSTSVRLLVNGRAKGPAGARNTGVFAARGRWIGFLDSDDIWYPDFLRQQREAFAHLPEATWRAAHFDVGDASAMVVPRPLAQRSPCLHALIAHDYAKHLVSCLYRPVDVLLRCGCLSGMTVQVERELIRSVGGFDESLESAEDFELWLRLASSQNLYVAPIDAGVYRVRDGSLTNSGRPRYYFEDRMLLRAKVDPAFIENRRAIDQRLRMVYDSFCYHFRARQRHGDAARHALRLIGLAPFNVHGWKQLIASLLRR